MGTAFATGQSCGVAAAQYARNGKTDVTAIKAVLSGQGALIDGDELPDPVSLLRA